MRKKRWRNRKGAGLLALALACVLALSGTGALETRAADAVNVDAECTLTVKTGNLSGMAGDTYTDEQIIVSLYRVAAIDESGDYTVVDRFEELQSDLSAIDDKTSAEDWEQMAQDARTQVKNNKITFDKKDSASGGNVVFSGLETGLYLVETENVVTDNYVYTFKPFLISLPNNYYYTTNNDSWVYVTDMELKPEEHVRYGQLEIKKHLTEMNGMPINSATFVFQVDIVSPKGETDQRIASVTVDKSGTESAYVNQIPAGSEVKVTEIYSGAGYESAGSSVWEGKNFPANDEYGNGPVVAAEFTNQPDGTTTGGDGIENNFVKKTDGLYYYTGPYGVENNTAE